MKHISRASEIGQAFYNAIIGWMNDEARKTNDLHTLYVKWDAAAELTFDTVHNLLALTDDYDERDSLLQIEDRIIQDLEHIYAVAATPIYAELEETR